MRTQALLRGVVLLSRRTSSMLLPATRLDRFPMLICLHGSVEGCRIGLLCQGSSVSAR